MKIRTMEDVEARAATLTLTDTDVRPGAIEWRPGQRVERQYRKVITWEPVAPGSRFYDATVRESHAYVTKHITK